MHGSEYGKYLKCNDINDSRSDRPVLKHFTTPLSNWSITEEIKRLYDINNIEPIEPEYRFHRENCELTPFDNPTSFYKRGKSTSNSQKFQYKECNKCTNVLPTQAECFTYKQRINHKLPWFAKLVLSRTPVTRICDLLDIT